MLDGYLSKMHAVAAGLYISLRDALDPATPLYQEELRPLQLSEAPQPDRVVHAPGNSLQDGSLSELHPGSAAGHGGESGATPAGHTPFQVMIVPCAEMAPICLCRSSSPAGLVLLCFCSRPMG